MARGRKKGRQANKLGRAQAPQFPAVTATVTLISPFVVEITFSAAMVFSGIIDLHIRNPLISPRELKAVSWTTALGAYYGTYQNNLTGGGSSYKLYSFPNGVAGPQGAGLVPQSGTL